MGMIHGSGGRTTICCSPAITTQWKRGKIEEKNHSLVLNSLQEKIQDAAWSRKRLDAKLGGTCII